MRFLLYSRQKKQVVLRLEPTTMVVVILFKENLHSFFENFRTKLKNLHNHAGSFILYE